MTRYFTSQYFKKSFKHITRWLYADNYHDANLQLETHRSRLALKVTLLALVTFFVWATLAELDQVTRAPGTVIASSRSQVIQTVDGGVLQDLLVKEGDIVEEKQLLASLDTTKLEAAYLESRAKASALRMNVSRLKAEVFGTPINFGKDGDLYPQFRSSQEALFKKRQSSIREELKSLENMLSIAKQEIDMTEPLLKTGDVSRSDVLKLQRQAAELASQITNRRNKYFQDSQAELGKAEEELASVEQIVNQRLEQLEVAKFFSPMRGVVKNIRVTTIGGVLRAGEELMQIVPLKDDLIIEAKVKPADIGFLKLGQNASVKIDTFDYTVYGSFPGKVVYISADTLKDEQTKPQADQDFYRIKVQVDEEDLKRKSKDKLVIQPGMTATVEVKTGSNTVFKYLSKPIIKTLNESLGER